MHDPQMFYEFKICGYGRAFCLGVINSHCLHDLSPKKVPASLGFPHPIKHVECVVFDEVLVQQLEHGLCGGRRSRLAAQHQHHWGQQLVHA